MLNKILKKITPSAAEKKDMEGTQRRLLEILGSEFGKIDKDLNVEIFGSISRDTWLAHEKDIDAFVKFPSTYKKNQLEDAVTAIGGRILKKMEKRFAEHPYVRGEFDGYSVEIIPCYSVGAATEKISAVDRTPFHDEFVRKNLGGRADQVRLLKQFLKGIGCYGAEASIEGFSGYLCELLVIHYGSFEAVIEAATSWKPPVAIDIRGELDAPQPSGFSSPLVFVDPTDKERNVASALSQENLTLFIHASKEFTRSPKETFFFPKKRTAKRDEVLERFRIRGTHIVSLNFQSPDIIEDILYTQLRKAVRFLEKLLTKEGFSIIKSGFFADQEITAVFELPTLRLPAIKLHSGPPVNSTNESDFLKKHQSSDKALTAPFIKGDRWMVFLKREHTDASERLKVFLSQKSLKKKGIPGYIAGEIEKRFTVRVDEDAVRGDLDFLADFFDPLFPWEI
jgi:tRNA nucleotidyltransferase (CCA-adding enzyme)